MIKRFTYILLCGAAVLLLHACELTTVPCSTLAPQTALIPIEVDWSNTGLSVTSTKSSDVHRLTLRFFPDDGSEPFDRYLESDLESGVAEVPVGSYSVIAINETISDSYWDDAVLFTDVNDYDLFAAELIDEDEDSVAEPLSLVAWSLGRFEVTTNMAILTREVTEVGDKLVEVELTDDEQSQMVALKDVVMWPVTKSLKVGVTTTNLGSAKSVVASVSGLSRRVNLSTRISEVDPVTHSFELDTYTYDSVTRADADESGVVSGERICFAHSDDYDDTYTLDLEVTLADGTTHDSPEDLNDIDVGDSITSTDDDDDYEIEHTLTLPIVESGTIVVDPWDEEVIPLN